MGIHSSISRSGIILAFVVFLSMPGEFFGHPCDADAVACDDVLREFHVETIVNRAMGRKDDVILFLRDSGFWVTAVGITSQNQQLQFWVSQRGITSGSGPVGCEDAWNVALRCVGELSSDENPGQGLQRDQLICLYSHGDVDSRVVSRFRLSLEMLPESVKSVLERLPNSGMAGRLVHRIQTISSRHIEGVTGFPVSVARNDRHVAVMTSNGSIAIYERTAEGLVLRPNLHSLSTTLQLPFLRVQLLPSQILILRREPNNAATVVMESVPLDGSANSVRVVIPGGWTHPLYADSSGNLLSIDPAGKAYQFTMDVRSTIQRVTGIPECVQTCILSADKLTAVVLDSDGNIELWDTRSSHCLRRVRTQCQSCNAAFSPDGQFVAIEFRESSNFGRCPARIAVLDRQGTGNLQWFRPYDVQGCDGVGRVNWSGDSRFIFAAGPSGLYGTRAHKAVHIWDRSSGSHIADLVDEKSSARVLERSASDNTLWGVTHDGQLVCWDMKRIPCSAAD